MVISAIISEDPPAFSNQVYEKDLRLIMVII